MGHPKNSPIDQSKFVLIQKINKSFCYRDEIHKIEEEPIKSNIVWVERRKGAGFANDKPVDETSF